MESMFKALVIGEPGAGKTSVIQRYVKNSFTQNYRFTIGVDFALKVVEWSKNEIVRVQLWDIAGQERFGKMTHVYYKDASACIIVFDITERRTFQAVAKWKQDLDLKVQLPNNKQVPCILLANKCDNPPNISIPDVEIEAKSKELGFIAWFRVSAKENTNITEAMNCLIQNTLVEGTLKTVEPPTSSRGVILSAPADQVPDVSSGYCCYK